MCVADEPHFAHTCLWRQRVPKRHLPSFQCEHAFCTGCVVVCVVPNDDAAGFDVEFHIPGACMEPDTPGVELMGRPNAERRPGRPARLPGKPPRRRCPAPRRMVPRWRLDRTIRIRRRGLAFATVAPNVVHLRTPFVSRGDAIRVSGARRCDLGRAGDSVYRALVRVLNGMR